LGFVTLFSMMSGSSQAIADSYDTGAGQQVTVQVLAQDPAYPGRRLHY